MREKEVLIHIAGLSFRGISEVGGWDGDSSGAHVVMPAEIARLLFPNIEAEPILRFYRSRPDGSVIDGAVKLAVDLSHSTSKSVYVIFQLKGHENWGWAGLITLGGYVIAAKE